MVTQLVGKTLASAIGVGAAAWLLDGITRGTAEDSTLARIGTALAVGLILALCNLVTEPFLVREEDRHVRLPRRDDFR